MAEGPLKCRVLLACGELSTNSKFEVICEFRPDLSCYSCSLGPVMATHGQ